MGYKKLEKIQAYILISPVFLFYLIIFILPLMYMFLISFKSYNLYEPPVFIGFDNYRSLFQDAELLSKMLNTLFYLIIGPITLAAAFFIAFLMGKLKWGQSIFRSLYFGTNMAPLVALAVVFVYMFSPNNGIVNSILTGYDLPAIGWFYDPWLAKIVVMFIFFFINVGFYAILFLSGILGIDESLYAAAELDGANEWNKIIHITLPQLRPLFLFATILMMISIFQLYGQIVTLTKGGPYGSSETVFMYALNIAFTENKLGYSAAIVVVLSIIMVLTSYIIQIIGEGKE